MSYEEDVECEDCQGTGLLRDDYTMEELETVMQAGVIKQEDACTRCGGSGTITITIWSSEDDYEETE